MRKHGTVSTLQQVEMVCPVGVRWDWAARGASHVDRAEKDYMARLWVHAAKSKTGENLQVRIGEDSVEISVTTLTNMPDLLECTLYQR